MHVRRDSRAKGRTALDAVMQDSTALSLTRRVAFEALLQHAGAIVTPAKGGSGRRGSGAGMSPDATCDMVLVEKDKTGRPDAEDVQG